MIYLPVIWIQYLFNTEHRKSKKYIRTFVSGNFLIYEFLFKKCYYFLLSFVGRDFSAITTSRLTLHFLCNGYWEYFLGCKVNRCNGRSLMFWRRNSSFMLPCIVIEFFLNNQPDALIIQIYSVIKLYMLQASSVPIIRSSLLYIRHW
jgi:hypothetical protein